MGLDMYLYQNVYPNWDMNSETTKEVEKFLEEKGFTNKLSVIRFEAGYWRKANQIHNWFVNNVQDGEDDCGFYDVSSETLQKLLDTCKQVLDNKSLAESLLPSTSGFFFGSTDYDNWYFEQIHRTIEIIEPLIEQNLYLTYHSSW